MSVDLVDYVPNLLREVQPPGMNLFSGVSASMWTGYLSDAFWEARLDGFLEKWEADDEGTVTPVNPGDPDMPREYIALVILYAGIRVLRNKILNTNTGFRAKAGEVEFEQQNSANLLAEMLKQLKSTKDRIIDGLEAQAMGNLQGGGVMVLDAFSARLFTPGLYFGDPSLTGNG